ncbi:MAG: ABC transporter ATP-binding protein [Chromatiales bacterium 21-64-14]|nr:MAG: ABC transporter ATP-binding protein [Chromatiales bacterium 21-64-14]HQU15688.1 ABC transporter ATP-binding protein/permease [Gammaproteobacteria bacterium]
MRQFDRAFFRDVWRLSRPYWRSEERWSAWGLLLVIVGLTLGMVYLNVLFNTWYKEFYDALQQLNKTAFAHALFRFTWLAVLFIIAAVYQLYLNQMLQIRWRRWLTDHYLGEWLKDRTYYHMQVFSDGTDNPDQRISDDLSMFVRQTLTLSLGLLSSVVTLASFIGILWTISGSLSFHVQGRLVVIPGYMVWAALVYAVVGTWLTNRIGNPLVRLNFDQQRYEADFRFSLVRLRENSEGVALYGGEPRERDHFMGRFGHVFGNYWRIMIQQKRLTWFTSGYGQMAVIFPILVAAPRFFAKQIELGGLMQIASAFGQVQGALSYIVNSYADLANWHAVVDRLRTFERNMGDIRDLRERHGSIHVEQAEALKVTGLDLRLPDGTPLLSGLSLDVAAGETLLIMGASGSGKSTLIRAIAGLWPFGSGEVQLPPRTQSLFLPQRPYLPIGTLRDALLYPYGDPDTDPVRLQGVLEECGLGELSGLLAESRHWAQVLSLGEQQRIAFARVFLQCPRWLYMDEATSALDEAAEQALYRKLRTELPESAVISVGHRSTLLAYHQRRLMLSRDGAWRQGGAADSVASVVWPS